MSALIPKVEGSDHEFPSTDLYTSCGWFAAVLGVINIIIFTPFVFKEHNIAAKELAMMKTDNDDIKLPRPDILAALGLIFSYFLASFTIVLVDTLAEPLAQDEYGWSDDLAVLIVGVTVGIGGLICMATFTVSGILCKMFDERKVITAIGYPILVVGLFLLMPWGNTPMPRRCDEGNETTAIVGPFTLVVDPVGSVTSVPSNGDNNKDLFDDDLSATNGYYYYTHGTTESEECSEFGCPYNEQKWCAYVPQIPIPQLSIAFCILMCGYAICLAVSQAIFSKILGPRPQGLWMGLLTGSGALSRIIGPLFVSNVYTLYGPYVTFGTTTALAVTAMCELLALYNRIIPIEISTIEEVCDYDGSVYNEKF